ncbi:hypothetical protein EW026_g6673 [Hermanssonia centrifuga]|uniref:Uncharacterized protein n=1 Tax=Hermanssonia centrifuga TaxID=98765 RepID=A0A4S4KAG7_9APHY|nr:hypothetical protein EW026_g6673 [Hermanssonia centrifuga]
MVYEMFCLGGKPDNTHSYCSATRAALALGRLIVYDTVKTGTYL